MKNRYLLILLTLLVSSFCSSFFTDCYAFYNLNPTNKAPLTFYRPNYFLIHDSPVKLQLSFKYRLGFPVNKNYATGFYASYTQKSTWEMWDVERSRPFLESNYSPEFFYLLQFGEGKNFLRSIILGYQHESNGLGNDHGLESRSWERLFAGVSFRFPGDRVFFYARVWSAFIREDNPEISRYLGWFETAITVYLLKEEYFVSKLGLKLTRAGKGVHCKNNVELTYTMGPIGILPLLLYVQFWNGYGETLMKYDSRTVKLRAGIRFDY